MPIKIEGEFLGCLEKGKKDGTKYYQTDVLDNSSFGYEVRKILSENPVPGKKGEKVSLPVGMSVYNDSKGKAKAGFRLSE